MLPLLLVVVHLQIVVAARVKSCVLAPGISRMEVLPGIGWDNLRNKDMALILNMITIIAN